ncbi:MAG: ATP-binding protein [Spirochaetaceae bacterium]|nr:ATP-binding protein [Spirochaetaceae bacterium]MDT8297360.1 ATP-binding protein [Spirochaetaceae bacterium]
MFWKILARPFRRVQFRLTLVVTLAAAVASMVVSGLLLASLLKGFGDQDRMELDSRLLSYWAAWQYGGDEAVLERASADMREHGGRPFLLILDRPDGSMLGALIPGGWEDFELNDPDLGLLTPGTYATLRTEGIPYALKVTGARLDDGSLLLVGLSTENRQFLLRMYQRNYPWALAAIIAAGVVVGLFASRRLLSPINRLNEEIDRIIVTGELGRRIPARGTEDQLDGLIGRYNRLLDRVQTLIGGMSDTLDAVAHDLRTPLTRLRGHAELALSKGEVDTYEEALALVVEQTDQVGDLLSALMDITEAEHGMLHLDVVPCDLGSLAEEVCDLYGFVAEDRGQLLRLDTPGPVPIDGDPVRIRQIMGNLVDNAIKYGPEGGCVDVRCGSSEDKAFVDVLDDGPGVSESEKTRVFERLYRGDRSRGSRGLGLGLSMVKALTEAHGGTVSVSREPGRGAKFRIVLPALNSANLSKE